jgi:hypothetical protein
LRRGARPPLLRSLALALSLGVSACGPAADATRAAPPPSPLHVAPLTDLAPAASLTWLVDLRPRAAFLDGRLAEALALVFPEERMQSFARASGGVELREADELVVASYPSSVLLLAHQFIDPGRVEAAFRARTVRVEGRVVEGAPGDPRGAITRLWGPTGTEREQLAIFGFDAIGLERGRFGPLRAAELFAQGKLKRASPALRAPPLSHLAELLGDAPVRAFAPGPFDGDLERAAGGLLGASTAVGGAARVVDGAAGRGPGVAVRVILLGAWGPEAPAAAERLRAVFDLVAVSGVGRLMGLAHCTAGPTASSSAEALTLDWTVDAGTLAEGLRAATGAEVSEIMGP